jgi:ArsR family transcriptional regulator
LRKNAKVLAMDLEAPDSPAAAPLQPHLRPELFRALGEPTRLRVLVRLALARGPATVTEVAGCCGVHLSGVSRHLACLREVGLVRAERSGREVRYELDREALTGALRGLADALDACAGGACCSTPIPDTSTPRQERR